MCFNPRTHEGCDLLLAVLLTYTRCFNPRTHEGCDSSEAGNIYRSPSFQSTHPRGVRLSSSYLKQTSDLFQSTHPRGVRLVTTITDIILIQVSIHAPTRGATRYYDKNTLVYMFQSTHPRGVRRLPTRHRARLRRFNPRTHEGCDRATQPTRASNQVSIHAPTRGATTGSSFYPSHP